MRFFKRADGVFFLESEADIVQAVDQALFHSRVEFKMKRYLFGQVECQALLGNIRGRFESRIAGRHFKNFLHFHF